MNSFSIRQASRQDADSIAALHAASWRTAYKGILSDEYLGPGLDEERLNYWRKKMVSLGANDFVLLAEAGNSVVGFIAVLDKHEVGIDSLIDNLHAHPAMKGRGIGGNLMCEAARKLKENNRKSTYLWVLEGNKPAEGFYLSKGARVADSSLVTFGGKQVVQNRFVWDSLDKLLE